MQAPRQTPLTLVAEISGVAGGGMIAIGAVEISTAGHPESIWANAWLVAGVAVIAIAVLATVVRIFLHYRDSRRSAPAEPTRPQHKGIVNKRGGVAHVHRPKYGRHLNVTVENEGEFHEYDRRDDGDSDQSNESP